MHIRLHAQNCKCCYAQNRCPLKPSSPNCILHEDLVRKTVTVTIVSIYKLIKQLWNSWVDIGNSVSAKSIS